MFYVAFTIFQSYHAEENIGNTGFYFCFDSRIGLSIYLLLLGNCDFDLTFSVNCIKKRLNQEVYLEETIQIADAHMYVKF